MLTVSLASLKDTYNAGYGLQLSGANIFYVDTNTIATTSRVGQLESTVNNLGTTIDNLGTTVGNLGATVTGLDTRVTNLAGQINILAPSKIDEGNNLTERLYISSDGHIII